MEVKRYEKIESTHKYLKENYKKYNSKTVIIADEQSAGIGTRGRTWFTDSNNNIAISVLYKPSCEVKDLDGITVKVAEILQKEIYKLYNIELQIKQPNDLMLNNKKICGILIESNSVSSKVNYLIISIGFNVNQKEFPSELKNIATSLKKEIGKEFNKEKIIQNFINSLEDII